MGSLPPSTQRTWWKDGTVYQIWPASYKDSNGDGVGDIRGIISTLDYLKDLGIDILWISPMYDSPQADMGYDISNYEDIYPKYGTLADAEVLIKECHKRGMRILFDLVINHTSDQHAWFKESRSSKDNPKRDWYIWRPAKYDGNGNRKPPNNWRAHFGGSAWRWDETSEEYFLHLFCPEQPDLNWENPITRDAIYASAVKFWLDKGIDGFRVDTVNMYSKGNSFPDAPIHDPRSELQFDPKFFCNGPRMHEFLRELNHKVLRHYDCMTVGELPHTPDNADVRRYISAKDPMLNMVFQFDLVDLGQGADHRYETTPFPLSTFKSTIAHMQTLVSDPDVWAAVFLENHDQPRSISRFASDTHENRARSGKLLAMLLAPLTGTLYLYQGQEIGMVNIPSDWQADDFEDVDAVNYFELVRARSNNNPNAIQDAIAAVCNVGRDNARTPVHWNDSAHGGFTSSEPWIRAHDLYPEINIKQQQADPKSVLIFWKKMLKMRKEHHDCFVYGEFEMLDPKDEHTLTFAKSWDGERVLICLNFSGEKRNVFVPKGWGVEKEWEILIESGEDGERGVLGGWEGRIYRIR